MACEKLPLDIEQLRLLVGDTVEPYDYTDEQYEKMYEAFDNIYRFAAHIWLLRSSALSQSIAKGGDVAEYKSGDESYKMMSVGDRLSYFDSMYRRFIDMAREYEEACEESWFNDNAGVIVQIARPNILGDYDD